MTIFPAIDLRRGRCVRLRQGQADAETVYYADPLDAARKFLAEGATWLHVVDLDGAFGGEPRHLPVIVALARLGLKIQLGGGMRTDEIVAEALAAGASRVVLGTRAATDLGFVGRLVERHGAEAIAVGIDARHGQVAVKGWVETTALTTLELARRVTEVGGRWLIHTDIATDGMLGGPNIAAQEALLSAFPALQVIASGGVGTLDDARRVAALGQRFSNYGGMIVGTAIYEGRVDVPSLLALGRS